MESNKVVVDVKNLYKYFPVRKLIFTKDYVRAVDGVSFSIYRGETFGLVGESGSGKTTIGRLILRLIDPTQGEIHFEGKNIMKMNNEELKEFRRAAQMVFQDPFSSLDPRMTIFQIIMEGPLTHGIDVGNPEEFVVGLLEKVGLKKEHL